MRKSTLTPSSSHSFFGNINAHKFLRGSFLMLLILVTSNVNAQDLADGQAAIEEAATGIEGYFDSIQTLVFIMAGIIALLGAIRVFMVRLVTL